MEDGEAVKLVMASPAHALSYPPCPVLSAPQAALKLVMASPAAHALSYPPCPVLSAPQAALKLVMDPPVGLQANLIQASAHWQGPQMHAEFA